MPGQKASRCKSLTDDCRSNAIRGGQEPDCRILEGWLRSSTAAGLAAVDILHRLTTNHVC